MTTLILVGILLPVLLLAALCVWLAVRLQRAERELEVWRALRRDAAMAIEEKIVRKIMWSLDEEGWDMEYANE